MELRLIRVALFVVVSAYLGLVREVNAEQLPLFGKLPSLEKKWRLRSRGDAGRFHWVVLTNAETSDFLSFASYKLPLLFCPSVANWHRDKL